jgi:hypothetical protein
MDMDVKVKFEIGEHKASDPISFVLSVLILH